MFQILGPSIHWMPLEDLLKYGEDPVSRHDLNGTNLPNQTKPNM